MKYVLFGLMSRDILAPHSYSGLRKLFPIQILTYKIKYKFIHHISRINRLPLSTENDEIYPKIASLLLLLLRRLLLYYLEGETNAFLWHFSRETNWSFGFCFCHWGWRRGGQWVRYGKKHVTTSSLVVLRCGGTVLHRKVNHSDGNRKDVLAIIK